MRDPRRHAYEVAESLVANRQIGEVGARGGGKEVQLHRGWDEGYDGEEEEREVDYYFLELALGGVGRSVDFRAVLSGLSVGF